MFVLSKLIAFVIAPLNVVLSLLLIAAFARWRGRRRIARAANLGALLLAVIVALTPASDYMLRGLEDKHHAPADLDLNAVAGVIVLGGAQGDGDIAAERGTYLLNSNAERMTEVLALRIRNPELKVIASGGSGRVAQQGWREPEINVAFYTAMGLDPDSIIMEGKSRNTFENALFTAELIPDHEDRPWLLLTSASHMPRSVEIFRARGIAVIPYPVDYKAHMPSWSLSIINPLGRFQTASLALREYIGIWYFRLLQSEK